MNVFDLALEMESEARAEYEHLSAGAETVEMKTLFSLLADSEREHYEKLVQLKKTTDGDVARSVALEKIKARLPEIIGSITHGSGMAKGDDGYVRMIKSEDASIRLYEKLAEKEQNPKAASLLRLLADEERHHLEVMEHIYDYAEAPRTYLASGEFSNLRSL